MQRVKLRDRKASTAGTERIRFTSTILPRWARRTRSLDALLPILYLRGVSMGDFGKMLAALLGRAMAEAAIATFAGKYGAKYDKAVACLTKDQGSLLTFYDFPAEHWNHLRTSNPIKSVFATVRHRTVRTKSALSQDIARLMVFKPVMAAARTWRRLKGENQLPKVVQDVTFRNNVEVTDTPAQSAT